MEDLVRDGATKDKGDLRMRGHESCNEVISIHPAIGPGDPGHPETIARSSNKEKIEKRPTMICKLLRWLLSRAECPKCEEPECIGAAQISPKVEDWDVSRATNFNERPKEKETDKW